MTESEEGRQNTDKGGDAGKETTFAEETKESIDRFESLRQELSSTEFKKSLLNHQFNESDK